MPFQLEGKNAAGRVRVSISAPTELLWTMVYLHRGLGLPEVPALGPLKARYAELSRRVAGFWKEPKIDFIEGLILAERGKTLEMSDAQPFLASLEKVAAEQAESLALPSESPEERVAVSRRLRRLAASAQLRKSYRELLESVWVLLKPGWRREGQPLVERTAAGWRRELGDGRDLGGILFRGHIYHSVAGIIQNFEKTLPVVLTPSYFASKGGHIIVLPSLIHVAAAAGPEDVSETLRRRAHDLSRRLKVLADPTRLAILFHLVGGAYTVGEMAARFQLSQPTMSGHLKALRDEGLVDAQREGQRVPYRANQRRIAAILEDVEQGLLVSGTEYGGQPIRRRHRQ